MRRRKWLIARCLTQGLHYRLTIKSRMADKMKKACSREHGKSTPERIGAIYDAWALLHRGKWPQPISDRFEHKAGRVVRPAPEPAAGAAGCAIGLPTEV